MEDSKGAIYTPPKGGLPFLVVTFEGGAFKAKPAKTRAEARVLLAGAQRREQAMPATGAPAPSTQ
jgi:hypothetical protein